MKSVMRMLVGVAIRQVPSVLSIIRNPSLDDKNSLDDMKTMRSVTLDQEEVEKQGSHCIDGSAPEYSIRLGKYSDKWAFDIKSPAGMCVDEEDCFQKLPVIKFDESDMQTVLEIFDENGYNTVLVQPCDFGMYLGNREHPVNYKGKKLYYQGARIIKHIMSDIVKNYTMREVILLGGSGGAQALYAGANYFQSLMPDTVHKFGIAPINGWHNLHGDDNTLKYMFRQMHMRGQVSRKCASEMGEGKAHLCLIPTYSYNSIEASVFITQAFDGTFKLHVDPIVGQSWDWCLDPELKKNKCNQTRIDLLQSYMKNFTSEIKSHSKTKGGKEGGYFTTCAEHVFYKSDHYSNYKNNGISAEKAIWHWWTHLESATPRWHWPCKLSSSKTPQCEASCRGK